MINIAELIDTAYGGVVSAKENIFEVLLYQGSEIKLKIGRHESIAAYHTVLFLHNWMFSE